MNLFNSELIIFCIQGTICYQPDGDEETEDENAQTDNGNENNEIGIDAIEYNDSNENFQDAKH